MPTNKSPQDEILHSPNQTKLTEEEIAKAVAHHNKHHSADKAENDEAKTKKPAKR